MQTLLELSYASDGHDFLVHDDAPTFCAHYISDATMAIYRADRAELDAAESAFNAAFGSIACYLTGRPLAEGKAP